MTAEAYEKAQREMHSGARNRPERSLVGPVKPEDHDGFAASIKNLLADLEPRITPEALSKADALGELPPAQQTLLRCALTAASESCKKAETIQEDVAKVRMDFQQAEAELLIESQPLNKRSAAAEAQVARLSDELAASVAANDETQSRLRKRSGYLWIALGTTIAAGIVYAVLLFPPRFPAPSAGTNQAPQEVLKSEAAQKVSPVDKPPTLPVTSMQTPRGRDPIMEQALDRLDMALGRVPRSEMDSVVLAANQWLVLSRSPQCFVPVPQGELSVLVSAKGIDRTPLRSALVRCADAVDHVVE